MEENMKKTLLQTVSVLTAVLIVASSLCSSAFAATYKKGQTDTASSSYMSSKFYQNFLDIPLTGDGRTDVLAVALSQLGYSEGAEGDYDGTGNGTGNYTEYNYNMGDFGTGFSYEWCATFVSWALLQSGCTDQHLIADWCRAHTNDKNYIWREVGCPTWATQLRTYGYFQKSQAAGGSYIPRSGDLIFFSWNGATSSESHIGIVVYSDGTYVYTVEGNTSSQSGLDGSGGGVYFKKYLLSYSYITGYGVLPYAERDIVPIDYSGANPTAGLYISTCSKYVYENVTDDDYSWILPKYTMFEVHGVAPDGKLKATVTTSTGETVTGYVLNNTDRVIQLTASGNDEIIGGSSLDFSYNLSKGKVYTSTAPNRGDTFDDDGVRLTDGYKNISDPGSAGSAGWSSNDKSKPNVVEITVDLGEVKTVNTFNLYFSGGNWGIALPTEYITVEIETSIDKKSFQKAASKNAGDFTLTYGSGVEDNTWSNYTYSVTSKNDVSVRYVKFVVTHAAERNGFIWMNEVEAMLKLDSNVIITGVNEKVTNGSSIIFTPEYNGGVLTESNAGLKWTMNALLEWNDAVGRYIVISKSFGLENGITLGENQILVATHSWESGEDAVYGSEKNYQNLASDKQFRVGDLVILNGIDLEADSTDTIAYIKSLSTSGDVNGDYVVNSTDYFMVKRYCLGTHTLTDEQILRGDVNGDGKVQPTDYLMIKRAVLGTLSL